LRAAAEPGRIGPVGIEELAPVLIFLAIGAWYLHSFWQKHRAGGGGASAAQQAWREELGFEPGEQLSHAWFGVMYVGPLRPDVDYSTVRVNPRIFAPGSAQPFGMPELTGRTCRVALSDRGRLAISIEVSESSSAGEQLRSLAAQGAGMSPLQLFGPEPPPRIQSAEQAFASIASGRDALGPPPRMRGATGELVSYQLVHITGPELPSGITLWLDPAGARFLMSPPAT
jgi:hypothetical protein